MQKELDLQENSIFQGKKKKEIEEANAFEEIEIVCLWH